MAPYTTLKIGGPARYFASATSEPEVREALRFARERNLPVFVLGGGSNLVVSDAGFVGLVLHVALTPGYAQREDGNFMSFEVSAGMDWDAFVLEVCTQGLSGVECLAGIPGLVGGTPVQNVGAYGQEVAQTIASVTVLDREDLEAPARRLAAAECGFGYRRSRFNATEPARWIVLAVEFRFDRRAKPSLTYADLKPLAEKNPTPLEVYECVRRIRAAKGMLIDTADVSGDTRSAGSFFKNPVVASSSLERVAEVLALAPAQVPHWPAGESQVKLPAAWLIERAGFSKGFAAGNVGLSSRHTLALINSSGTATCAELLGLRDRIVAAVEERFGVRLEQEPVLLG